MTTEDTSTLSVRAARGLRQAPPQRTPFHPDTAPGMRQTRTNMNDSTPPSSASTPVHGGASSNPNSAQFNVNHFEGRPQPLPMAVNPVDTPGNRRGQFAPRHLQAKPIVYHFDPVRYLEPRVTGANIYTRCVMGLRSGIPQEVQFALFHLVNIAYERGDKLRLESFPLLAEGLIEIALKVTELCTGVPWFICYDPEDRRMQRTNVLNGCYGTADLLERIRDLPISLTEDELKTEEFSLLLNHVNDATHILRNLVINEDNAVYLSKMKLFRDFLTVGLNVPRRDFLNEVVNNTLEIAGQVTRYWTTSPTDPLFKSLLNCWDSDDRTHILESLRCLAAFALQLEEPNRLQGVEPENLEHLIPLTYIDGDPELMGAALDFLYQYTAVPENVEILMKNFALDTTLIPRLINLLTYQAHPNVEKQVYQREKRVPAPREVPNVPSELLQELLPMPEPERSARWLRSCYVEDDECEVTQIAIWQAYQKYFAVPGRNMLVAAEFIKNVTSTFPQAQAQVVNSAEGQQYVIKGIRPLHVAYSLDGFPFVTCRWVVEPSTNAICGRAFSDPEKFRAHVFADHLELEPLDETGEFKMDEAETLKYACRWQKCTKFLTPTTNARAVAQHIENWHLPSQRAPNTPAPSKPAREILQHEVAACFEFCDTPMDERGEPYGIAYQAALVLRNLARNLPRQPHAESNQPWIEILFLPSRPSLLQLIEKNRALRNQISDIVTLIDAHGPRLPAEHEV